MTEAPRPAPVPDRSFEDAAPAAQPRVVVRPAGRFVIVDNEVPVEEAKLTMKLRF